MAVHPPSDQTPAPPDLKERIVKTELDVPKYLADSQKTAYGVLYWDKTKKTNHYLNHAVIYPDQVEDLKEVLGQITRFYRSQGIQPRVRQPFTTGFFMNHANEFRISGYDIQIFAPTRFMLLTKDNQIRTGSRLAIRELKEWDERVARDILLPDGNDDAVEQIRRSIAVSRYRVLVGYLDDRAVSMATIFYGDHGVARLDSAETAEELRGRGYARELISAIVDMHRDESRHPLYLWPQNNTAEKIFREAGFTDLFQEELASATYHGTD